jgi:hypothetical protein
LSRNSDRIVVGIVGEGGANTSPHLLLDLLFKHLPFSQFAQSKGKGGSQCEGSAQSEGKGGSQSKGRSESEGRNVEVVCFSLGAEGYCPHCHWCEDQVRLEGESVAAAATRIADREVRPGEGAWYRKGEMGREKKDGKGREGLGKPMLLEVREHSHTSANACLLCVCVFMSVSM